MKRQSPFRDRSQYVVPHVAEDGLWTFLRVTGQYSYDIPAPEPGDYGHILPAEYATDAPVNPYDKAVPAVLRQTMKCQLPLWNIDYYSQEIDIVVDEAGNRTLCEIPGESDRLDDVLAAARDSLKDRLFHHYQANEFENACEWLLKRLFHDRLVGKKAMIIRIEGTIWGNLHILADVN
jgi:hypothetical protein